MMCGPTEEIHPFVMESASSKRRPMRRRSLIEDKVSKCIRIGKVGTFILLTMGMLGCIYFLGVVLGNVIIETMSTDETFSSPSAAVTVLSGEYTAEEEEFVNLLSESSFVRDKVTDLVVKEYVATSSDWYTLDTAMDALDKLENDAEPVGIVDHDFMFVGSVGASLNHESLLKNGITHIVNWSGSAKCNVWEDIEYMCILGVHGGSSLVDDPRSSMGSHLAELDRAVDLIESVRKSGGRLMSHCWEGKNRSVTLLVAYLMKYEKMSAYEATELIQETRPIAAPYFDDLDSYNEQYAMPAKVENKTDGKMEILG